MNGVISINTDTYPPQPLIRYMTIKCVRLLIHLWFHFTDHLRFRMDAVVALNLIT